MTDTNTANPSAGHDHTKSSSDCERPKPEPSIAPPRSNSNRVKNHNAAVAEDSTTPAKPAPKVKRQTKASQIEALLQRKRGATLDQMCEVTGWQPHTCRAFMSGMRKKGRDVVREPVKSGKSIYRLAAPDTAAEAG